MGAASGQVQSQGWLSGKRLGRGGPCSDIVAPGPSSASNTPTPPREKLGSPKKRDEKTTNRRRGVVIRVNRDDRDRQTTDEHCAESLDTIVKGRANDAPPIMNGNGGHASPSGSNGTINGGPVAGPSSSNGRQQRTSHHHPYNPHHTPTFYPQQNYGGAAYGGPNHQQQPLPGFSNPYGNVPPAGGYAGYEFIPQQQQQMYAQQYAGGGYPGMGGYYPSNPSGPLGMPMAPPTMHQQHPGMIQGMGIQQNGAPPPLPPGGRFPPVFTPQQQTTNGVNGHPGSPYPAFHSTSPALANSVPPATSPQTTNGIPPVSSYPTHEPQNPYAHLQQHHAHHNPYANMSPSAAPYTNGVYQPFTPIHPPPPPQPQQQPISPAVMNLHPQTPKMNARTSYGYPVGNVGGTPSAPVRKPPPSHDSGVRGPEPVVENGKSPVPEAKTVERDGPGEEESSDSEPVFASINQAVEQAKKSRHARKVSSSTAGLGEDVPSRKASDREEEPIQQEPTQQGSPPRDPPQPVISDSFIEANGTTTSERPQRPLWTSSGRPCPVDDAPGVTFHRRTRVPGRLYPVIKTWASVERGATGAGKLVAGQGKQQRRAVAWRGGREVREEAERVFGEVTAEIMAEVREQQKQQQGEARVEQDEVPVPVPGEAGEVVKPIIQSSPTAEPVAIPSEPSAPAPEATPSVSETASVAPSESATTPASTPAPAPKAAPKSWAALLRTASKPSSSTPAIVTPSTGSVPSSNITSPRLAASAVVEQVPGTSEGSEKTVIVSAESAAPAPAPTPASAPAKPVNAWGSRPMIVPDQLDLGKLLAEGLDERTRASLKRVTSVPRGLINTGNMCFANSVSVSGWVVRAWLTTVR